MGKYESLKFFDDVLGVGRRIIGRSGKTPKPEQKPGSQTNEEYGHDSHGISKLPPPPESRQRMEEAREAKRRREEEFDKHLGQIMAKKKAEAEALAWRARLENMALDILKTIINHGEPATEETAARAMRMARVISAGSTEKKEAK